MSMHISRRNLLKAGGALVVSFAVPLPAFSQGANTFSGKTVDTGEVDGFFAVNQDGSVTLFCGKVDLGTGLRIAVPQMAAEELGIDVKRITLVEGDTDLTPDQGPTAGSSGVMRGGVQIRQAAATAREALIRMAAERLGRAPAELIAAEGEVRPRSGGAGITFGALLGNRHFGLKLDPKAKLKDSASYTVVGQSLPRPDVPGKITGRHLFMHDFKLPGMLHGRAIRPSSVGAKLIAVDESSIKEIPGARVVRIGDFLGVLAEDEWDCICAARALKANWSDENSLVGHQAVRDWMLAGPFEAEQSLVKKGDARGVLAGATQRVSAFYYWPPQSHASMGPSCAVADIRPGKATIWTASQATHRYRHAFARILELPPAAVRLIYLDGSGCYGMNGHEDAAADAVLLSRAANRPVRVQWMRADELGWDPKGPPQLLSLEGSLAADGSIDAWRTEMWLPRATANLPNIPLLSPEAAGIKQVPGISFGLITQNGDPSYAVPNVDVSVHWLKHAPLRPSNIRAPGKVANMFAVESFTDELAALAASDPFEFRLRGLSDARGIEVLKRTAALIGWQARSGRSTSAIGRGIAYCHYKHNENYVAMAMEVEVVRASGRIHVRRVACAHDCGLVINPDALRAQIEGNILQTLSRTLFEEVHFDRARVTSTTWGRYPILTFPDVPEIRIELVQRQNLPPWGGGEAASAPVPAALANAIYDACGARLRTAPFTRERVRAALEKGYA